MTAKTPSLQEAPSFGEIDAHLFAEGTHRRVHDKLGAHVGTQHGQAGTRFSVWAPNASQVSVIGDFNGWRPGAHPLTNSHSGVWSQFVPGVGRGNLYKYHIQSRHDGYQVEKTDPYGFLHEVPPKTASVVWPLDYEWNDAQWMAARAEGWQGNKPISIYEVHLGSWMRHIGTHHSLSYREVAPHLAAHVSRLGFTHVELMPVMEHPFFASWGYQVSGYYAPSARYGTPQDLMFLIDTLHQHGIGVILDWVPAHFPSDGHSLGYFDGTYLYEHAHPMQRVHPEWTSLIFNYGRHEVRSFLISNAIFWLEKYHADGLRVDGVSSMLYLDYGRKDGEWIPNPFGGKENLEAVRFLQELNYVVHDECKGALTIAEESTAWPRVSGPAQDSGLGFDMKWDMGWMHDTLRYMKRDPIYRRYHHNELTFRSLYAGSENYALPLSHDEVVHLKGSLIGRMPGDDWQKYAGLRLLLAYQFATPGKKLLFMGAEFGQFSEWNHDGEIDWFLKDHPMPQGVQRLLTRLNELYRSRSALYAQDFGPNGLEWVEANDHEQSVLSFIRHGTDFHQLLVVLNFTPEPRHGYRVGVSHPGVWNEVLNTDAAEYGGSNLGNLGGVHAHDHACHGRSHSLEIVVPPLGAVFLEPAPK
jgi:1,4-alpha-glucan branching enzyme